MSRPKAAIVLLTRGYPRLEYYQKLVTRNIHIYDNFNRHLEEQYPLIIFHEGNISEEHQTAIIDSSRNQDITFVSIGKDFTWPENVPMQTIQDNGFHPGYRLMCRFNCYQIWKYVKDYDYILRIDEDTYIGELKYDLFQYMQDNNLDYMVSRFCEETHKLTNETIPAVAHELLGDRWTEDMYNQHDLWVPYTNLYAAKTSLFLQQDVQIFLRKLCNNPMFLTHRWGDHVVMGIVLKAFSSKDKVTHIHNFQYMHGSHQCITKDGKALEGILSKREAEVFGLVPSGKAEEHYILPQ
jgi:hypothetical protein